MGFNWKENPTLPWTLKVAAKIGLLGQENFLVYSSKSSGGTIG
jgi:hypothetical protein